MERIDLAHEASSGERGASSLRYTLVELLVVVSIIIILLALLMPSLKSAQELANRIACMSNMRMLGLATLSYSYDYNNYLPPHSFNPPWPVRYPKNFLDPYLSNSSKVWNCQSHFNLMKAQGNGGYYSHYGETAIASLETSGYGKGGLKTTKYDRPYNSVMFAEARTPVWAGGGAWDAYKGYFFVWFTPAHIHGYHRGALNVLMVNGCVQLKKFTSTDLGLNWDPFYTWHSRR